MDTHPKTDLDAPMSNPEEEEDQYESGEEDEELDNEEDSSGVNPPPTLSSHHRGHEEDDPSPPPVDFYHHRRGSSPDQPHDLVEDRKRLERELLAQKELMIKREERDQPPSSYPSNNGRSGSSKSTTPSPSSPQQQQYLYAANYPFPATAAAFLTPSHLSSMAAAQAVAAQASAAAAAAQQSGGAAAGQLGGAGHQHHHHSGALSSMGGLGGGESSAGSATPPNNGSAEDQSKYTFEEQFKQHRSERKEECSIVKEILRRGLIQLYEISDDPRRREFLDDLFNFMQRRGTPVNRVPIMAKQVLDLYELYRLVVARGGLVEVINKKIWREITKGLNLPSSITSAAFTLRTQYMRYLYPYECDREKLSSSEELQAAIDGNRREGRRSSYGPYGEIVSPAAVAVSRNSQHPPLSSPLSLVSRHVNGHGSTPGGLSSGRGSASPLPLAYFHTNSTSAQLPLNLAHQENGLYGSHGISSVVAFGEKWLPNGNGSRVEQSYNWSNGIDAKRVKREDDINGNCSFQSVSGEEDNCNSIPSTPNPMVMPQQEALNLEVSRNSTNNDQKPLNMKRKTQEEESMSTTKRLLNDNERYPPRTSEMPQTHIKISTNRGPDGRLQPDASLAISMEVNGILYQGVLYAAPNHRNRL